MPPKKRIDCLFCGKKCPTNLALELHINMHTRERPYMCRYCDSSYASGSSLWVHENAVHLGRKYICDICKNEYSALANLLQHRKRHGAIAEQNKRPKLNFVDQIDRSDFLETAPPLPPANQRSNQQSRYSSHPRTRISQSSSSSAAAAPKKSFECDICQKVFAHEFRLKAHRKLHGKGVGKSAQKNTKTERRGGEQRVVRKWDASFFLHMNRYVPET